MRIRVYLDGSGKKNSDIGILFLDPDFFVNGAISEIWGRFQLIFHRIRNTFCGTWYLPHIATAQRPKCSYNKGYIAYFLLLIFHCACAKRPYFCFRFEDVFSWYFFIGKAKGPPYFYFRFILPADHALSHPRWSFPPSFKLLRLSIVELQRCWCGYVTWPCDLDLWPFDLKQWSKMAGHVLNPSTKFEDPTPHPFLTYELWCPP